MVSLSNLLRMQWVYVILGTGYNIVSYIAVLSGGQQFSTTSPLIGTPVMMMYGLFLMAAYLGKIRFYRGLMCCSILIYGWGGIIVHLINWTNDPILYVSFTAWATAVGINIFGLGLSLAAALGKFKTSSLA